MAVGEFAGMAPNVVFEAADAEMTQLVGRTRMALMVTVMLACAGAPNASAETRSFVVGWFYPADYYDAATCPDGLNPLPDVFFKRDLALLGVPKARIDDMFDQDYNIQTFRPMMTDWVKTVATRGNGRDSVYANPTTIPDRMLKLAEGRFGYGFNLDGKGAASPNGFEDPDSHEQGVDNQLFRAIGCIQSYRGGGQRPLTFEYKWAYARPHMPAWVISITADDLSRDGPVTVAFDVALDPADTVDANGDVQAGMTYRLGPDPRAHNALTGRMEHGVITTAPAWISLPCDSYMQPSFDFRNARLRLTVKPDGRLQGLLGGYQDWYPVYWSNAKGGYIDERGFGVDAPALYYALKKSADADPDPATGQNRGISAAYMIEAAPAFVTPLPDRTPMLDRTAELR
jgi:hypothetical protein